MKKLLLGLLSIFIFSLAAADNSQCWDSITGQDDESRPDVICKELTQQFILSFRGATREQVVERMTSTGAQPSDDVLHYLSNAEKYGGDINFEFIDNKVAVITAVVGDDNYSLVWNAKNNFFCSSLPGSDKKCPKHIISPTDMLGFKPDSPEAKSIQAALDRLTIS